MKIGFQSDKIGTLKSKGSLFGKDSLSVTEGSLTKAVGTSQVGKEGGVISKYLNNLKNLDAKTWVSTLGVLGALGGGAAALFGLMGGDDDDDDEEPIPPKKEELEPKLTPKPPINNTGNYTTNSSVNDTLD